MLIRILLILVIVILTPAVSQVKMLFLGDSLTAGYQLDPTLAFPNQLELKMGSNKITAINQGISGDTSHTLLNRLDFTLQHVTPNLVFLCIGANDGLRGMPIQQTEKNIQTIITKIQTKKIPIIMAGMSLPDNYSANYIQDFEAMYERVASKNNVTFMPFLLKDVAGVPSLNLTDRIHPNAAGHKIIANNIYDFILKRPTVQLPKPPGGNLSPSLLK